MTEDAKRLPMSVHMSYTPNTKPYCVGVTCLLAASGGKNGACKEYIMDMNMMVNSEEDSSFN